MPAEQILCIGHLSLDEPAFSHSSPSERLTLQIQIFTLII